MAGGGGGGGGGGDGDGDEIALRFTPTWIVAAVCSAIIFISILFERLLHRIGKNLIKHNRNPLYEALLKVKEEMMLVGFIALLLTVLQGAIQKICIPESFTHHWLPCKGKSVAGIAHYGVVFSTGVAGGMRRLLAGGGGGSDYCQQKGKVPLLSVGAIHLLHIFIFILAVTHVVLSVMTVLLGIAKIQIWRKWENSIQNEMNVPNKITFVRQSEFIQNRIIGFGTCSKILSWMHSFFKQFYGSVTKTDYKTMRLGFIMNHCPGNPKFNFYIYMIRVLESDFKKVVGISWYLWAFLMIFLLLNVEGWNAYLWISFIPLILLLVVGTKLEHIIVRLAENVAERHSAVEGDIVVTLSDNHFWFRRPKIILILIHFILFQNAFEIAYFFWILTTNGFRSCIMGKATFTLLRLFISVISQILCSYSTLPLYVIVTQMGSTFKKDIFDKHIQANILDWATKAKEKKEKANTKGDDRGSITTESNSREIPMSNIVVQSESSIEEGTARLIQDNSSRIS